MIKLKTVHILQLGTNGAFSIVYKCSEKIKNQTILKAEVQRKSVLLSLSLYLAHFIYISFKEIAPGQSNCSTELIIHSLVSQQDDFQTKFLKICIADKNL